MPCNFSQQGKFSISHLLSRAVFRSLSLSPSVIAKHLQKSSLGFTLVRRGQLAYIGIASERIFLSTNNVYDRSQPDHCSIYICFNSLISAPVAQYNKRNAGCFSPFNGFI